MALPPLTQTGPVQAPAAAGVQKPQGAQAQGSQNTNPAFPIINPPIDPQSLPLLNEAKYSKDARAFIALFGLTNDEYDQLEKECSFSKDDKTEKLIGKVSASKSHSQTVKTAKKKIERYYFEYLPYLNQLDAHLKLEKPEIFREVAAEENKIISKAFKITLDLFKDEPWFKRDYEILERYGIADPLNVSREILDHMSIYEETRFHSFVGTLRAYALSNLHFDEMQNYLYLQESIDAGYKNYVTQLISLNRKEFSAIREQQLKSEAILADERKETILILDSLTNGAKALIQAYQAGYKEYEAAINTSGQNDDISAVEKMKRIIEGLRAEVENEYQAAYIDDPTEEEKQSLKSLLHITAQLKIMDRKIIYYARLSNSGLSQEERDSIEDARIKYYVHYNEKLDFTKRDIDPQAYKKASVESWIMSYPEDVQHVLYLYSQAIEDNIKQVYENNTLIGKGIDKKDALFFALEAIGFSEKELLMFEAIVSYSLLPKDKKELLSGSKEEDKLTCLYELKRIYDTTSSDNYEKLDTSARAALEANRVMFYSVLSGNVGSWIETNYLGNIYIYDQKTSLYSYGESSIVEGSPEEVDDHIYHLGYEKAISKVSDQFGLDPWTLISNHLAVQKITGEPIDQEFVNEMLSHSSLQDLIALDGEYGLDEFKNEFILCLTYKGLEATLADRPNYTASKEKLASWLREFVAGIRECIKKDPSCAGSEETRYKLGILNLVQKVLIDSTLFTQNEIDDFIAKNPLVEPTDKLAYSKLGKGVYFSKGYDSLPEEIRNLMEKYGYAKFCRDYSNLLDIYWVPDDNKADFKGYAMPGKNPIVVVCDDNKVDYIVKIVHELRHKVDAQEFDKYARENPKYEKPFDPVSRLITERNAYLLTCDIYANTPKLSHMQQESLVDYKRRVEVANILLGLAENNKDILHPPYASVDLKSGYIDYDPSNILISTDYLRNKLIKTLDSLEYTPEEKQFLLDYSIALYSNNIIYLPTDQRNLFVSFLQILAGELVCNGRMTARFEGILAEIRKLAQEDSDSLSIGPKAFAGLLDYYYNKHSAK